VVVGRIKPPQSHNNLANPADFGVGKFKIACPVAAVLAGIQAKFEGSPQRLERVIYFVGQGRYYFTNGNLADHGPVFSLDSAMLGQAAQVCESPQ